MHWCICLKLCVLFTVHEEGFRGIPASFSHISVIAVYCLCRFCLYFLCVKFFFKWISHEKGMVAATAGLSFGNLNLLAVMLMLLL